ncbi:hypothetical protein QR680_007556 [Steinernema hermaphroditum]|uniref:RING-type domain-containing protein n=1 Tax=Steinernema hermaphroditum TaxID=289476 RepID=A0AA39IDI9_9BILA|nr:hypothetical protein QR680_007556 [Steinernema hermaphroditum]
MKEDDVEYESPFETMADALIRQLKDIRKSKIINIGRKKIKNPPACRFDGLKMKIVEEYVVLSQPLQSSYDENETFCFDLVALRRLQFPQIAFSTVSPKNMVKAMGDPAFKIVNVPVDVFFGIPPFPVRKGDIIRFKFKEGKTGIVFQVSFCGITSKWFPIPPCDALSYLALQCKPEDFADFWGICPFFCSGNVQPILDFLTEDQSNGECTVCFNSPRHRSVLLPCCHVFCYECVDKFNPAECPLCKVTFQKKCRIREYSCSCFTNKRCLKSCAFDYFGKSDFAWMDF